ncbi:MAG TPA: SH3 domain-containing C40 family peptidase [Clostridia bacterium]|nr:SH3 domain-containing C40 family peptidase [Clostridia bacterium]
MVKLKRKLIGGLAAFVLANSLAVPVFASNDLKGKVTASVLNLRIGPSITSQVIDGLPRGTSLQILSKNGDWYNVITENDGIGWVNSQYVAVQSDSTSRGDSNLPAIVEYSERFIGTPYVWGGNDPSGFDCSGFVKYVYHSFGFELNRVACDQAKQGTWVGKTDLLPGDLVFFDTDGGHNYINHVGMYIGNGMFIHASSSAGKVTTSNITKGFYSDSFMMARRILK